MPERPTAAPHLRLVHDEGISGEDDHSAIQEWMNMKIEEYERTIAMLEHRVNALIDQNTSLQAELFAMENDLKNNL